ncbi:MAG: cell division protein FtsQ/DivIB [Candidatus Velthaea sp.]
MNGGARGVPRRKKPSLLARLRVYWVFCAAACAALVYSGYVLVTLPQLRVHAVTVRVDGPAVDAAHVLRAARIDRTANAWLLDGRGIAARIEAIPYVARARVVHHPPADIAIVVTERAPIACVRTGSRTQTIDAAQRVLQDGCASQQLLRIDRGDARPASPGAFLEDGTLARYIADVKTLSEAGLRVRSVGRDRFGDLVATDDAAVELRLGSDDDLAAKAALIGPVRTAAGHGRPLKVIDVRAPATPVVQFASGSSR